MSATIWIGLAGAFTGFVSAMVVVFAFFRGMLDSSIKAHIRAELDAFGVRLNGTYWRTGEAKVVIEGIQRESRLELHRVDQRIDEVSRFAISLKGRAAGSGA